MRLLPLCSLTLLLAPLAYAQTPNLTRTSAKTFLDPANLSGERVPLIDGQALPVDQGVPGLQQMLRRLSTRASILNIVAHPDDEDGGMLTLYSRGFGAQVADLALTRGEGGQNAMTGDFEDSLGLLRTQELLANDRYTGVEQMFGTEVDFGFSKTKEEAFKKWTHERVLYDAVRAIRIFRPLVITATFVGGVTDGHGQHQVSGEIAQEAIKAAGDPKVFPELTAEGILPWQPLKVYARVPMFAISDKGLFDYATNQYIPARFVNYATGQVSSTPPTTNVVVHEGTADPLLVGADGKPLSYVQFARIGLGMQKSQIGPGLRVPPAGKYDVDYHRYGSMLPATEQKQDESNFFDGIDTSIEGIASLAPDAPAFLRSGLHALGETIARASSQFSSSDPAAIAPLLAEAMHQEEALLQDLDRSSLSADEKVSVRHELRVKLSQTNQAIVLALDVKVDAMLARPSAPIVMGEPFAVNVQITGPTSLKDEEPHFTLRGSAEPIANEWSPHAIADGWQGTFRVSRVVVGPTQPYFHRHSIEQPYYDLTDPRLRLAPATPAAVVAEGYFRYHGEAIRVLHTVNLDYHYSPTQTINEPASVIAPITVTVGARASVVPFSKSALSVPVEVRNLGDRALSGTLHVHTPPDWPTDKHEVAVEMPATGDPVKTTVNLHHQLSQPTTGPLGGDQLAAKVETEEGKSFSENLHVVGYPGLISTNEYTPAARRIVPVDLKLPAGNGLRIGYLPGTGDAVPEALASIGLKPEMLTVADLTADKLSHFETIILGVRTYAAHPDLHGAPTQALLAYARSGGNVVVQYQTDEFTASDAPYPLTLGRDAEKVVDETDPVTLIHPASPLLTTPNRITPADFNGWVEERGHGFLRTWDDHYTAFTEVHDPGAAAEGVQPQLPQRGGLITTQLGKGRWTYLAFAVYRQLPEAVPGAYRLFVNLINP